MLRWTEAVNDEDLLRAHEPIVRYNQGELFFPVSVDEYVRCCDLVEIVDGKPTVTVPRGKLDLDLLGQLGSAGTGPGFFLRLVDRPFSTLETARWRRRSGRALSSRTSRLARVGLSSRIIDALVRSSLVFRGTVVAGSQAAAEVLYRERMRADSHPYYGRVVRRDGFVALQYWMFYAFNDWRSRAYGVNDHEGDWEQVVVYLAEQPDGSLRPAWIAVSAHDETGDALRRRWDDPEVTIIDGHPVVFAGLGSHSGAFEPGEYLTTLEPPAFRRLAGFVRRVSRILLPWTWGQDQPGVGIPYIDYAVGDGLAIGPDQERSWDPVLVGDDTPWVFLYRGLWGNDTRDPLGGERGPAGPRYERSGLVRQSWGDVLGWCGVAKLAPNPVVAADLVRRRIDELRAEADALGVELAERRIALRADTASGVPVTESHERELQALVAEEIRLNDEGRMLQARLDHPSTESGEPEPMKHHRRPLPTEPPGRRRLLALWAAVSTPLILAAIGLAFLPQNSTPVTAAIVFWLLVLLTVEALARRRLVQFVVIVVALATAGSIVASLAALTVFAGWRVTVACVFGVLAGLILVSNLRELVRA